jgi:RNA recognition motif-containing protein
VISAKVIMDRETGRSKGFGFVEMSTEDEAKSAIAKLNNSMVGERRMFVNEARPMEARPRPAPGSAPSGRPAPFPPPSFGDKPNFGPDKRSYNERKKKYEDRKGDGGKKGGKPGKDDFGGKRGRKNDFGDGFDDDGGW